MITTDPHIVTCRQWFNFLKKGKPTEYRELIYQLPGLDTAQTATYIQSLQLDLLAVSKMKTSGKIRISEADNAFNDLIKSYPDATILSLDVITPKADAVQICKDRFKVDATFKTEYYTLNHVSSEFEYFAQTVEAFVFFCFDVKNVKIKPTNETVYTIRKSYAHLWAFLVDRSYIFSPMRISETTERDYFKEFYKVKASLNVDMSIDKTSVFEYYTLIEILKNK